MYTATATGRQSCILVLQITIETIVFYMGGFQIRITNAKKDDELNFYKTHFKDEKANISPLKHGNLIFDVIYIFVLQYL